MRAREAGFTLLEMVVAVGIAVILLAAGGFWMLSMRPAALRGALDDFDSNLASAKALAASSGNGATLVFAPQTGGAPGFTLRVYSGRPNASNAVTATNTMAAISATSVSEAHFGNPPFAIFLNSAGYPTGTDNYPSLDAQGNPTFNVIAQQPPCPSGGIVLTFTSPQGVTATRTLPCNTDVAFAAGADPTPTPNPPHISPTYLLAHYTTDSGPLKFKAAEYGYYHWYASTQNGAACQMGNSDTGAAPATFASPWPYAQPSPSSQGGAAPARARVRAVHLAGRRSERSACMVPTFAGVTQRRHVYGNRCRRLQPIGHGASASDGRLDAVYEIAFVDGRERQRFGELHEDVRQRAVAVVGRRPVSRRRDCDDLVGFVSGLAVVHTRDRDRHRNTRRARLVHDDRPGSIWRASADRH